MVGTPPRRSPAWQALKLNAERAFRQDDFVQAARLYEACICAVREQGTPGLVNPSEELAKLYANKCLALQRRGMWEEAIVAAQFATQLNRDWDKGSWRGWVWLLCSMRARARWRV